jgi:hypothetical protein
MARVFDARVCSSVFERDRDEVSEVSAGSGVPVSVAVSGGGFQLAGARGDFLTDPVLQCGWQWGKRHSRLGDVRWGCRALKVVSERARAIKVPYPEFEQGDLRMKPHAVVFLRRYAWEDATAQLPRVCLTT